MALADTISGNIRALRNYYGETGKQLGDAIGCSASAISMYESGDRQPGLDTISQIAKHYGVPEMAFVMLDFTESEAVENDISEMLLNLEQEFPIIVTGEALKNRTFADAYKLHNQLYKKIQSKNTKCLDNQLIKRFEDCIKSYSDLISKNVFSEISAANVVGICILYTMMLMKRLLDVSNQRVDRVKWMPRIADAEKVFGEVCDEDEVISELITRLNYPDMIDTIIRDTKILIKSSEYHELGEYYLALQYGYGIIDNDNDPMENYYIGWEMLSALAKVDNKYAKKMVD